MQRKEERDLFIVGSQEEAVSRAHGGKQSKEGNKESRRGGEETEMEKEKEEDGDGIGGDMVNRVTSS